MRALRLTLPAALLALAACAGNEAAALAASSPTSTSTPPATLSIPVSGMT